MPFMQEGAGTVHILCTICSLLDSSGEAYQDSLLAAGEQVCAVWAEGQAADWAGMPVQGLLGQAGVSHILLPARLLRRAACVALGCRCHGRRECIPEMDTAGDIPSSYALLSSVNCHTLQMQASFTAISDFSSNVNGRDSHVMR